MRYRYLPASLQGLVLVALSALLYSFIPLSVDLAVNDIAPTVVGIGQIAGYALIHDAHRRYLNQKIARSTKGSVSTSYRRIWDHLTDPETRSVGALMGLGLVGLSAFSYVAFGYATVHLDAAIASSMWEFWPMVWLLTMALVDRNSYGPRKPIRRTWNTYALMLVAVLALAMVAASSGSVPGSSIFSLRNLGVGLLLATIGPVLAGFGSAAFLFADRVMYRPRSARMQNVEGQLHKRWEPRDVEPDHINREEYVRNLKSVMVRTSHIFGRTLLFIVIFPIAIGEVGITTVSFWKSFLLGMLVGAVLNGPAALGLQEAHVRTQRREIIAMQYMSPLLAVVWLSIFSNIVISRMDMFLFGTVAVVAINMLINLDPEIIRSAQEDVEVLPSQPQRQNVQGQTPSRETRRNVRARHPGKQPTTRYRP